MSFSNSSEAEYWQANNCWQCAKYEIDSKTIDKAKCRTSFAVDLGYVGGKLTKRVEKIISEKRCKYFKSLGGDC